VVRVDDTDFILSTLWSRITPANEFAIWQGMSDFYQIRYGEKPFMPGHYNDEHKKCLDFIKKSVEESDAKHIVVVTHHLPTMAVVAPHHKRSPLNSAFANELDNFIADSRIDVWIYGHSHTNIDTEICGTRIVCNQLGYVQRGEHEYGFDGRKFIEV
jgi:hypothetical protein